MSRGGCTGNLMTRVQWLTRTQAVLGPGDEYTREIILHYARSRSSLEPGYAVVVTGA